MYVYVSGSKNSDWAGKYFENMLGDMHASFQNTSMLYVVQVHDKNNNLNTADFISCTAKSVTDTFFSGWLPS